MRYMYVTERTGRDTYVTYDGVFYLFWLGFGALMVIGAVALVVYYVFCWPEAIAQALAPKDPLMVTLGWIGSVIWTLFLLTCAIVLATWDIDKTPKHSTKSPAAVSDRR
jgi:amino acid transporter